MAATTPTAPASWVNMGQNPRLASRTVTAAPSEGGHVEQLSVILGDGVTPSEVSVGASAVDGTATALRIDAAGGLALSDSETLKALLVEARVQSLLLTIGLGISDSLDTLRADEYAAVFGTT